MKNLYALILLVSAAIPVFAQSTPSQVAGAPERAMSATRAMGTSSEQALGNARALIAKNPNSADGYIALGIAMCYRAEESFDANLYGEAEKALNHALELSPNNFEAQKGQVCIALGRHEFAHAHDMAIVLNRRVPDDVMVYGFLVDADVALGNYGEAEKSAQWMLNLRPGNTPALVRAARLREVFGDQEGAIELLRIVLEATATGDVERRVLTLTQIAHLNLEIGNLDDAEGQLKQALTLLPSDSRSLNNMAQLSLLRNRPVEAVGLLRQSHKAVPDVATLYALAEAMEAADMKEEATRTFADFEQQARAESLSAVNANRELIFYYADHVNQPVQALQVAEQELSHRHDVYTLDAYAWALHKNGRDLEAKKQMDTALKVGVRDASIFYRAGEIESRLGNLPQAQQYLHAAAELHSVHSPEAQSALAALPSGRDGAR